MVLDEEAKKEAWKEHHEHLLNVAFPWYPDNLSDEIPGEGLSKAITTKMITIVISHMTSAEAAGPVLSMR